MKDNRLKPNKTAHTRKVMLLVLLLVASLALTGCYIDQDRVVSDDNGLNPATGGQQFDTVITPTPEVTATPTPAPTNDAQQQVDFENWDFSNDTATNPPSNVINVGDQTNTNQSGTGVTVTSNNNNSVSNTVSPTATATLPSNSITIKKGSKGDSVKKLQQKLKDLGYYSGSVDGSYGDGTASAVSAFQSAHKLTADGVAGNKTQEILYSNKAVKNTSGTTSGNAGSSSGNNNSSSAITDYSKAKKDVYLKLGSNGTQVKYLQNRLISLGYLSGTADGNFAETTEAAVVAFQNRNSIFADGVAGPTTLTKLYSSSAKKASSVVANLGSLKLGMTGSGVRALQTKLKELNYYTGSVDGSFGDGTHIAVVAFQNANGLTADGVAGKATLNLLYGGTGTGGGTSSGTKPESYGESANIGGYKTLSSNNKSSTANVTALQNILASNNYYTGTLDGDYGTRTIQAVKDYQSAKGLRVTGTAGPATQRALYNVQPNGSYSTLNSNSSGSKVKDLQYTLYELQYYDGNINGKYDDQTKNAVMLFQQVNNLAIDGVAGSSTLQLLYSGNAIASNLG